MSYFCHFILLFLFKDVIEAEDVPKEPNYERILQYLGNYPLLENQSTFFKNIFQLPGSHFVLVNAKEMTIERYRDIEKKDVKGLDAKEKFLEYFKDSIRLRLRSDVTIGTCLSGGLILLQ
ncbi:MAG: asparagine synthase-related protein [Methanofastidiosum sp.]